MQRLIKERKIKQCKSLPEIQPEEVPYKLPKGWEWVRLGYVGEFINGDRGKNYPNRDEYVDEGIPWINTGHIEPDGSLTQTEMNFISREKFNSLNNGKIQPGDLVYCLRGATFGKTAIVDPYQEGAIASSLMIIRPFPPCSNRYIYRYLVSPIGRNQIYRFDNGSAQPNLSANSVQLYVFPLPPLAEQKRIVAKVDELMKLCDQLEASLRQSQQRAESLAASAISHLTI
jgi:type I restriction enzyme S subunit